MNITTAFPNYPVAVVPAADLVRSENRNRELVNPPTPTESSPQQRGLGQQGEPGGRNQNGDAKDSAAQVNNSASAADTTTSATDASKADADKPAVDEKAKGEQSARNGETDPDSPEAKEEQEEIRKLEARDREVRIHEQQHAAVGGQYAGSPTYSYERGPNGRNYASEGEVSIDLSPIPNDPEATVQKMEQVRRAALAPAEPSGADRAIAAEATQRASEARAEMAKQTADIGDAGVGDVKAPTMNAGESEAEGFTATQTDANKTQPAAATNGIAGPTVVQRNLEVSGSASVQSMTDYGARGDRIGAYYANAVSSRDASFSLTA
ncbi:MAG: putative metalloprotease CJM1_0395 family protein [Idiomarina sp.]